MMRRRGVNIRVTNNSWGAPEALDYDQALKDAIDDAGNTGILNVCAAGRFPIETTMPIRFIPRAMTRRVSYRWQHRIRMMLARRFLAEERLRLIWLRRSLNQVLLKQHTDL